MNAALENLTTSQTQLDADGCMVGVSRQASDETLDLVSELLAALQALVEHGTDSPQHLAAEAAILKATSSSPSGGEAVSGSKTSSPGRE